MTHEKIKERWLCI